MHAGKEKCVSRVSIPARKSVAPSKMEAVQHNHPAAMLTSLGNGIILGLSVVGLSCWQIGHLAVVVARLVLLNRSLCW